MAHVTDGVNKVFTLEHKHGAMNFDGHKSYEDAAEALLRRLWPLGAENQIAALEAFKERVDELIEVIRAEANDS